MFGNMRGISAPEPGKAGLNVLKLTGSIWVDVYVEGNVALGSGVTSRCTLKSGSEV